VKLQNILTLWFIPCSN